MMKKISVVLFVLCAFLLNGCNDEKKKEEEARKADNTIQQPFMFLKDGKENKQ